jgi:hypothetical protein
MKVFHGSNTFIETVDLNKGKLRRDFGRGFYVTKLKHQAENMAIRVAGKSNGQPTVTEFEFDEYAYDDEDLHVRRFETYDEAWLDFIILNRQNKTRIAAHDYDIVEGPVADDAVSVRIYDYLQGMVTKNDFLKELIFKQPSHQLCFCTRQSLLMLEHTDNQDECNLYHTDKLITQQLMTDKKLSDKDASRKYYTSSTYRKLIDKSTGMIRKPMEDIYKLLLMELKVKN